MAVAVRRSAGRAALLERGDGFLRPLVESPDETGAVTLMDTVTILRELWRVRLLVVGVCVLALLAGAAVRYQPSFPPKSRQYDVGVANTSILLDTPSSQVVDVAPKGSDTLGMRANLLASLMVDGVVKTAIAQNAGLNPNELIGTSTSVTDQPVSHATNPRAPRLTTQVITDNSGAQLPIITVQTQANDAAAAVKLAMAAVTGLQGYLNSKAATEQIPDAQRLHVTGLGVPQAETATRGPSSILAVGAVIFVFGLGCAAILGVLALIRGWRAASPPERAQHDPPLPHDSEPEPDQRSPDQTPETPGPHVADSTNEHWRAMPRPEFVSYLRRHN